MIIIVTLRLTTLLSTSNVTLGKSYNFSVPESHNWQDQPDRENNAPHLEGMCQNYQGCIKHFVWVLAWRTAHGGIIGLSV